MQRIDEAKRHAILSAAERLFTGRPFHEVHLDDVAAAARVGKGTLYIYFDNKDDLYLAMIEGGFRQLIETLRAEIDEHPAAGAWETLSRIVESLVAWMAQHPDLFDLMRSADSAQRTALRDLRRELGKLIESVLVRGVREGSIDDPNPMMTAQFVPGMVRGALRHGPAKASRRDIAEHILRVLGGGDPEVGMKRIVLGLLLLCGACAVHHDREIGAYRDVLDLPDDAAFDPSEPLDLRTALLLANRWNENLAIDGEAYLRQIIERRRAVAEFLPTVDFSPNYTIREDISGGGDAAFFDAPVEVRMNLFNGFRDVNRYWRDTYLIERERQALLASQETLLLDVARVYFQVLRAESLVRVLENSLDVQDERLRDTRGRFDAGLARALDVAQTEAQVSATRVTLITARNDVENARSLLAFLTVADVRGTPLLDESNVPQEIESIDRYYDMAAAQREDLRSAGAAVSAARHEVEVAFGQYYPSVSLDLAAFVYRESVPDARTWDSFLLLNLPIFSAGRIEADVRDAWSFFREALLVESLLRRQVRQEIEITRQNLMSSFARRRELGVVLEAAQQAFEQSEQSYREGLATNLDRVIAQHALLRAQLEVASEEFELKVFYLDLQRAAGALREELESALDPVELQQ